VRTFRTLGLATAAIGALVIVAGCAGTASPAASAAPPSAAPPSAAPASSAPASAPPASAAASPSAAGGGAGALAVSIVDFSFNPATTSAKVGETVTWTNTGQAPHTVTFDDGSAKSDTLNPGDVFERTFDAAGTFTYKCSIHPAMTATVEVTG
jgi:plastocyanin